VRKTHKNTTLLANAILACMSFEDMLAMIYAFLKRLTNDEFKNHYNNYIGGGINE